MYPSDGFPFFGTFVKTSEDILRKNGFFVEHVVIDKKQNGYFKKFFVYLSFYINVIFKIFKNPESKIYAHYVSHTSIPLLFCCLFLRNLNIISHTHGGDIKKLDGSSTFIFSFKRILSRAILIRSKNIIAPSFYYKKFILEEFPEIPESSIIAFPSGGIDNVVFSSKNKFRDNRKLGFAGRLIKSKNVDLIVKAMVHLPEYTLEIVGQGHEQDNLEKLVSQLGLDNQVKFMPAMSQTGLADWYHTIGILVYPSSSESLGLVPLESISCKAYCVLSDIPAFNEFLNFGLNFHMLEGLSSKAIVESVLDIESKNDLEDIRNLNRKTVFNLYGKEKISEGFVDVFK